MTRFVKHLYVRECPPPARGFAEDVVLVACGHVPLREHSTTIVIDVECGYCRLTDAFRAAAVEYLLGAQD